MAAVTCIFPHDSHAHPACHIVDLEHFGAISNIVHLLEPTFMSFIPAHSSTFIYSYIAMCTGTLNGSSDLYNYCTTTPLTMHVVQSFGNILVQISTLYTYQKPTYRSINLALYSYTPIYRYFKWLQ